MNNVIPMIQERRGRRSESTYEAIFYQLEHVLHVHGLRNFTLSDDRGLVLAQAGFGEESEALAAYAPVLARCADRTRREDVIDKIRALIEIHNVQERVHVRSFLVDGQRLFLCVLGESGAQLDACLYRALTGIRRIFRQSELQAS